VLVEEVSGGAHGQEEPAQHHQHAPAQVQRLNKTPPSSQRGPNENLRVLYMDEETIKTANP
jgi:hypothetical protein